MTTHHITSVTNPRVKTIVKLRGRKPRDKNGLVIVEGWREIDRAVEARVAFEEIYICCERLETGGAAVRFAPPGVPVYETTKEVFTKISYGNRAEGILALCRPRLTALADLSVKASPLLVIIEAVEKPGNLGAILRTCDGAGVDGVILCDPQTDAFNPNVIRASLGTVFSVPVAAATSEQALKFCRDNKIKICASTPAGGTVYTAAKFQDAVAVVVGSEEQGLTDFWTGQADMKVTIPMRGRSDSLNVSASTAILLYEIIRQRAA